jgi:hypothetical protein
MQAAQRLEKEILACEAILKQLDECLKIFLADKRNSRQHVKNTLKDIVIVKAELKRLIAAKEAEMEAGKGAAIDHDDGTERSSEAVS